MVELNINEQKPSVKIAINAKGQFSAEVKVYAETVDEAMKKATEKAKELETLIAEKNKLGRN